MDPQSQSFTPYIHNSSDNWRFQTDVARIQQVQIEHADRISRLERRQVDDARMKSVWGNQSPFPSVLSGTPQQAPLQHPPGDQFRSFEDEATTLMSSLHLDADDEPRRGLGANSRANSVRFDESANQNHFSHSTRPSVDLLSRTSSGLGGFQMTERTSSHKSEGRASSAHSFRSIASGRANSLNLDTAAYGLGDSNRFPEDVPNIAPGLMLLGPAPAIIRCWMNTNFKHDALLYAAVCTGSFRSYLDLRLIEKLGFESVIRTGDDDSRTVELPMYFPEAVPHPSSSRSSSPNPTLPSLQVEFLVVERTGQDEDSRAIQIFLGSDVLRAHSADIMFSSNSMTIFDNERNKLSIPLTRPENEVAFNGLFVTSGVPQASAQLPKKSEEPAKEQLYLNGLGQGSSTASVSSAATSPPPGKYRPPGATADEANTVGSAKPGTIGSSKESRPVSRASNISRSTLTQINTKPEREEPQTESNSQTTPLRSGTSPAIWGNWRRDGASSATTQPNGLDWASASRTRDTPYQRRETGIKVLKPKTATRAFSTTAGTSTTSTASPADGKSRFFDDGRRRSVGDEATSTGKENTATTPSSSSGTASKNKTNPIGGGTAFAWLNSGGSK